MSSKFLPEDWHLLRNGQPWSHCELRNQACQAANEFMEHLGPDGSINDPKYLRVFSLYGSQVNTLGTNYDFGVSYLTDAVGPDAHRVARAAAEFV